MNRGARLPDPAVEAVRLWLKNLDREKLHGQGWLEANKRFNGITLGLRPFINQHYTDPKEQEAVFDGLTLALLAMAHFVDIERLSELFGNQTKQQTARQY